MDNQIKTDEYYMAAALLEARKAALHGEVPVGAVIVSNHGEILASAGNRMITDSDPSGHAEMIVIRAAAQNRGNYRLLNTTLYVTIEPCVMCMGAILHSRIERLVFGAPDLKWGGAGSLYDLTNDHRFNHRVEVTAGICLDESKGLIQGFFKERRKLK